MYFYFESTFKTQFEVLPRLSIIYLYDFKGFAIEWFWFSFSVRF